MSTIKFSYKGRTVELIPNVPGYINGSHYVRIDGITARCGISPMLGILTDLAKRLIDSQEAKCL